MTAITNDKVAGLEPRWATFRGFSLLFDNPGAGLRSRGPMQYIDCRVDEDPDLQLFQVLAESVEIRGRGGVMETCSFCPLPPSSYHVTVWDGVNDGNLAAVRAERRQECERFLRGLPGSLSEAHPFARIAGPAVTSSEWNIRFRFERLEQWSDISVVARIGPADEESSMVLDRLTGARAVLSADFGRIFGVRPHEAYVPHVTLGYFANGSLAAEAAPCIEEWDAICRRATTGQTWRVRSAGLYGFTDMATFFRACPSRSHR